MLLPTNLSWLCPLLLWVAFLSVLPRPSLVPGLAPLTALLSGPRLGAPGALLHQHGNIHHLHGGWDVLSAPVAQSVVLIMARNGSRMRESRRAGLLP